ncbi:MAG: 3-deoxy-D-manno-octulosonate 8-phosphate phosphatase [Candidatus Marinimicrobia bacterium]|nr:3-deoxy-D-manno-octulosonate 8-phosphate phosphatase [Candidatus Neomarinimicrobiota bacterium]|tara:strand:+ start:8253 stop:8735 length:483 start_codon:yes stop_codon:yes gene_type:complete
MDFKHIKAVVFDFDGVFTDNKVYVSESGQETVQCNRFDGIGIGLLKKLNIPMKVISSEPNNVVQVRCKKLDLPVINNVSNKLYELDRFAKSFHIDLSNIAFVGNDINDEECMKNVGFPIAVNDAVDKIKLISKHTLSKKGGRGAVRELCELIVNSYASKE